MKKRLDRLCVERLGTRLVHEIRIEGADLGGIRASGGLSAFRAPLEELARSRLRDVHQNSVDATDVSVRRNDRAVEPGAIAVAKKIVAGLGREVRAGTIETPGPVVSGNAKRLGANVS